MAKRSANDSAPMLAGRLPPVDATDPFRDEVLKNPCPYSDCEDERERERLYKPKPSPEVEPVKNRSRLAYLD